MNDTLRQFLARQPAPWGANFGRRPHRTKRRMRKHQPREWRKRTQQRVAEWRAAWPT